MTPVNSSESIAVRPVHFRDSEKLMPDGGSEVVTCGAFTKQQTLPEANPMLGQWQRLSQLVNPLQPKATFAAECKHTTHGVIQVSPFNSTRSTWRIDRVMVKAAADQTLVLNLDLASLLLRHCFETIVEAHTWISETSIHDKFGLALYRQNGFQPLAYVTYWSIDAEQIAALAKNEPDLPNLLPVSNADAQLIYHLETASMPPQLRQVFDHQIQDFRTRSIAGLRSQLRRWLGQSESVSAYVFEPQRKAAIGYFSLRLSQDADQPNRAKLTVHPAYTWLYPELMAQMAQVLQGASNSALQLASLDYQPERESYLREINATEVGHTVMMSRSVWHKVRESKAVSIEGIQDVLQGLQPSGKAIPSRFSWDAASSRPPTGNDSGSGTIR
ncbi:N-acetyltransferase [Leptolyngbya cf. ectocarpi LEGE 11479]|uniref:N-acetyltransferase n=1 Tax=Leptolyngbya cf. ectocarpi LEGE 11479 TaxID=1828722 RepID=A0A928ZVK9_LEPEC|nr:N-acetyltransferase [Leptolyngbya ectocarpi]MBE9068284.1 N-acetyltransferase [Leptolyngbya cf. ectocarpi LEGE 11479]